MHSMNVCSNLLFDGPYRALNLPNVDIAGGQVENCQQKIVLHTLKFHVAMYVNNPEIPNLVELESMTHLTLHGVALRFFTGNMVQNFIFLEIVWKKASLVHKEICA